MGRFYSFFIPLSISILFFIAYSTISLQLYFSHQTRGDLTAYAQGMWNTVNGHFMASTYNYSVHNYWDQEFRIITSGNSNILGVHFNPLLILFAPVYAAFPTPATLLLIQAFMTAVGGWIMFLIAQKVLRSIPLALMIEIAYLLYFATVSAVLSQFHAYTLSLFFGPLLILSSLYRQNILFYTSLFLFLFVQENTSLVAVFFGLYLILSKTSRERGILTVIISIVYFVLTIRFLIPYLSPYHFYLFSGIYGSPLGGNIPQIMVNSLTKPILFIKTLFSPENISYLTALFIGISPFAFLSPLLLIVGVSSLAQNLLSSSAGLKTQAMHYESGSVPFLFYAAILGISFVLVKISIGNRRMRLYMSAVLLILATGISYKLFTSTRFNPTLLQLSLYTGQDREMDRLILLIPDKASVSTQDYLSAHLSSRENLYQFPVYSDRVDYLLLSKGGAVWPLTESEQSDWLAMFASNAEYSVVDQTEHFILFKHSL